MEENQSVEMDGNSTREVGLEQDIVSLSESTGSGSCSSQSSELKQAPSLLVGRRPFDLRVPDHLGDTKTYPVANPLCPFHSSVKELHFAGYEPGKRQRKRFQLINKSSSPQRYHMLPATTNLFRVTVQKKAGGIVPGMGDAVVVDFLADGVQSHYYDYIRVHCTGDQNLMIPLHAYPVSGMKLPKQLHFRRCSILETQSQHFTLANTSHSKFQYKLSISANAPGYELSASSRSLSTSSTRLIGVFEPQQRLTVTVSFIPQDYVTVTGELRLESNELFSEPLVCSLLGSAAPGLPVGTGSRQRNKP